MRRIWKCDQREDMTATADWASLQDDKSVYQKYNWQYTCPLKEKKNIRIKSSEIWTSRLDDLKHKETSQETQACLSGKVF